MVVKLELVGGVVTFSPPLVPHFSLPSIPEVVAGWMESYVAATRQLKRVIPNSTVSRGSRRCVCMGGYSTSVMTNLSLVLA